jgi:hypothetical protein
VTAYDVRGRRTAGRLLNAVTAAGGRGKGQTVTLTRIVPGAYDPATSTTTGASTVTQTGSGALFEYTTFLRAGLRNDKGLGLIVEGDKQFLLSPFDSAGNALSPGPVIDDQVTLANGVVYTITSISPLAPAGLVIFYELNLRGSS